MSKRTNLSTEAKLMTEKNALRHYISKSNKALKTNDYEKCHKVWCDAQSETNAEMCKFCSANDFGYCEFRRDSTITKENMFMWYCFPSWLKGMEYDLEH